jgi:hypothetical protein
MNHSKRTVESVRRLALIVGAGLPLDLDPIVVGR